jgi:hypothetical protein
MVYSTIQHPHVPPPPQPHTLCIYCTFSLGRRECGGGGGQREGRGATVHKYIVPLSMSATVHKLVENTNHEIMYFQSIKSVKHSSTKSVNRSILKKSRHIGFGVFIVHPSISDRMA